MVTHATKCHGGDQTGACFNIRIVALALGHQLMKYRLSAARGGAHVPAGGPRAGCQQDDESRDSQEPLLCGWDVLYALNHGILMTLLVDSRLTIWKNPFCMSHGLEICLVCCPFSPFSKAAAGFAVCLTIRAGHTV